MHVTPSELRAVRRQTLTLRTARLGPVGAVLAEVPAAGEARTTLEDPCDRPHWAVVLRGEVEVDVAGNRFAVPAGHTFHVAGGDPAHRFFASRRSVLAGFAPLGPPKPRGRNGAASGAWPPVIQLAGSTAAGPVTAGDVVAETTDAGDWLMTQAAFGATSGYGSDWCDVSHWGVVVSGGLAIEYEDDGEVLGAGDFYYCPPGPPGHKFEVADGATIVDFTPRDALARATRLAYWRSRPGEAATAR